MARVNVRSTVEDESAVIPAQEGPSQFVLGYLDFDVYPDNLLGSLGFTHEREQGYMTISSVGEWHERLKTNQPTGFDPFYTSEDLSQVNNKPFFHVIDSPIIGTGVAGNTYAGGTFDRWPSGSVNNLWNYDWNIIENYLQYGGTITIFSPKSTSESSSEVVARAKNRKIYLDALMSQFFTFNNSVREIADYRQDCIAITSVPSENVAGSDFGRAKSPDIPAPNGSPESFFAFFAGDTWGYTGEEYGYDPVPSGVLQQPGDHVFLKNTGDYKYPSGRNVFSVYVYDSRPVQGQFGSTAELIDYSRYVSIGLNEESYGCRGFTLAQHLMSGVSGITGYTLAHASNWETDFTSISGELFYFDGTNYLPASSLGWDNLPDNVKNELINSSGITFFSNTTSTVHPGRMGIYLNLYSYDQLPINTVGRNISSSGNFSLKSILLPSNWMDPWSWTWSVAQNTLTSSYDILPGGLFTKHLGYIQANNESSSTLFDLRKTFDSSVNHIDYMHGATGWLPNPTKKSTLNTFYDVILSDLNTFRNEINIFATADTSLGSTAAQYWGATCCTGGIPTYLFELTGTTPDICVDFGPKSTTTDVTADGSTYQAYIGYSRPLPDITITALRNIYGEYIGPATVDGTLNGATYGIEINEKLSAPGSQPATISFRDSTQTINCKSILIYPLIEDLTDEFALTADKENYFYGLSTTLHDAGNLVSILCQRDKNWPSDIIESPTGTSRFGRDFSTHWYNGVSVPYQGGMGEGVFGKIGNPGETLESQIFGQTSGNLAYKQHNGITAEGIYLLAEIDVFNGKPTEGFGPADQFDPLDFTYNNIFSSNADLYEFPVFGEKYAQDSYKAYKSLDEANDLRKANEIPFTSDVAGMFARLFRDLYPWYSPANQAVSDITDIIAERYHLSNTEQDDLYDNKINFIKQIDGALKLWGDKTFANSTSTFSRVNVANLFIYLKKKIEPLGRRFLFEQNDAQSRELFVNAVEPFLTTLKGNRAITDFRVICDETNNTPDIVDSNQFVAEILVKPTKTINYIRLKMTNVGTSFELE